MSVPFSTLEGKIITKIDRARGDQYEDMLIFYTTSGILYLYHEQDSSEDVVLEDVVGDLRRILHQPVLRAEVAMTTAIGKSETYSFYTIVTNLDTVVLRFYGTSNGCYSETADLFTHYPGEYEVKETFT